jgi:hypothetical protein
MRFFAYGERTAGSGDDTAETWRKSSRSYANAGCVEVAPLSGELIGVRDSKRPRGVVLRFKQTEWAAFVDGVREGKLDRR